jgi:hypothetical protein
MESEPTEVSWAAFVAPTHGAGLNRADNCSAYDEYFKAYSVAVMDRKERPELLYGGKSELAGPWLEQLRV